MSKIDDARDILEQLGLPPAQRNDIACLTLLALSGLSEDGAWRRAYKPSLTIHQILGFMRDTYGREYAENTRESVRRQVIHQFEQAPLVDRNPDSPDLPTNTRARIMSLQTRLLECSGGTAAGGGNRSFVPSGPDTARFWRYTSAVVRCGRYPSTHRQVRKSAYLPAGITGYKPWW